MVSRKWLLLLLFLGPAFSAGCGGVTDANVKEKVFTEKDVEEIREQQKRLAELQLQRLAPPTQGPGKPSRANR